MRLIDILNAPWAIRPEKLAEITDVYSHHVRREKIDLDAIRASLGRELGNQKKPYDVIDGVAVLGLEGVLAKKMNLFMEISGGTSTQLFAREFRDAIADPQIVGIVLNVDSPGGTAEGTEELARLVLGARDKKPIVAFSDGIMASAAYWIGSAADQVFISSEATTLGSIGVAMQHVDYSKRYEQMGIKPTDIYAGKYKRIASSVAPLSEEGRDYLQSQVDHLYAVFVDAVAQQRGVGAEAVLKNMADGRIFLGQQAIDAGLADGASSLDALISELAAGTYRRKRMAGAGAAPVASKDATSAGAALPPEPPPTKGKQMDLETLKRDHPQLAEALRAEGADAERTRIKGIESAALAGHEELVARLKFDGKTSPGDAALMILAAEQQKGGRKLAELKEDADPASKVPAAPAAQPGASQPSKPEQSLEERCKASWDGDAQLRSSYGNDYKSYLAYEKAAADGKVRVLGAKK